MYRYRQEKFRYRVNDLGSLYVDKSKIIDNDQPIIYVGGLVSHYEHAFELTGLSPDPNYNMYTGCWMYDYPIFSKDKKDINAMNFSENLLASLDEARLKDVVLVTFSHGGIIGAYASKSELVDKVISIHPALLRTPLANYDYLTKYKDLFTETQKIIMTGVKYFINYNYGYEQDNFNGADLSKVDLNKLLVVGNYLNVDTNKRKLLVETYRIIEKVWCCII